MPNEDLYGVSCAASNDCWAVGKEDGGEVIIHWDGSSWSRSGPYGSIPDKDLFAITAVSGGGGGGSVSLMQWTEIVQ